MRHFICFTIALLGSVMAVAQIDIPYTETFDALNGWDNNTSNENWVIDDSTAYLNSFNASGFISFKSPFLNTTTVPNPALQFDVKINAVGGCKPELKFRTSTNGGATYTIYEISVTGQTCSSADISIPNNTWRTIEVYNLPPINNYLISLSADFFGGSGSIRVDNIEFNTRDSLSMNLPEPPDTTTTAIPIHQWEELDIFLKDDWLVLNSDYQNLSYKIIGISGTILSENTIKNREIDCSSYSEGIYILVLFDTKNQIIGTKKFIIN